MGGGGNPPVVTLVEPEDPDVGDPGGAERTFTAECDQPATLTVYLDDELVCQSEPGATPGRYNDHRCAGSSGFNNVLLLISIMSYNAEITRNK